jgi:hypothetical protein
VSQIRCQTQVQDEVYENVEMRDPSTTHGRAITHFCVARRQGVNMDNTEMDVVVEYIRMTCNGVSINKTMSGRFPLKAGNFLAIQFESCLNCACNEASLMHYLSSVYSVTSPLHFSGLLVDYHQEVTM